jgi:hypothetical protein
VLTGFSWLRIGTTGGNESGFHRKQRISVNINFSRRALLFLKKCIGCLKTNGFFSRWMFGTFFCKICISQVFTKLY